VRHDELVRRSAAYYTEKFMTHGPSPAGVDWNSHESQELRFRQLLRVAEQATEFALLDYGCGFGALAEQLDRMAEVDYVGYDVSEAMIDYARTQNPELRFVSDRSELTPVDYVVASGVLNVKQEADQMDWHGYVLETLDDLDRLATRGFAFNMLTSYSDPQRMRPDLYYGDPCAFFAHCKSRYARNVALLHDYGLWEFTILVRKELG
jgi:SAM-dependent methyltransferase